MKTFSNSNIFFGKYYEDLLEVEALWKKSSWNWYGNIFLEMVWRKRRSGYVMMTSTFWKWYEGIFFLEIVWRYFWNRNFPKQKKKLRNWTRWVPVGFTVTCSLLSCPVILYRLVLRVASPDVTGNGSSMLALTELQWTMLTVNFCLPRTDFWAPIWSTVNSA